MSIEIAFGIFTISAILLRLIPNSRIKIAALSLLSFGLISSLFFDSQLVGLGILSLGTLIHYLLLKNGLIKLSYLAPLGILIFLKSAPTLALVGYSFFCFRLLSATLEFSSQVVKNFSLVSYFSYCFYFPTFKLGPIGSFKDHLESEIIHANAKLADLNWSQLARVLWGITKYIFLASYFRSFAGSFGYADWDQANKWIDLLIIGFNSYIFVFLTFSGFNDISIGITHFLGLKMKENFEHPFRAHNISNFWSNWHISLTDLLKELVFYPLQLNLVRRFGKKSKWIVTPFVFLVLFLLIGVWHGVGLNFVALGLFHSVGAITAFYFSQFIGKRWKGYSESRLVRFTSIALTQSFIALSFLFFDNSLEEIQKIITKIYLQAG